MSDVVLCRKKIQGDFFGKEIPQANKHVQEQHSGLHTGSLLNCPRNGYSIDSKPFGRQHVHTVVMYILLNWLENKAHKNPSVYQRLHESKSVLTKVRHRHRKQTHEKSRERGSNGLRCILALALSPLAV